MDESKRLPPWIRLPLIGAGLFFAGGMLAFGYSYRPLHGAMTWKVEELEQRIDARNLENLKLGDELARLRSQQAGRIDPETLAQVERELDKTKKALGQSDKDLKRSDRKRKEAISSGNRWRKRYEDLRDQKSVSAAQAAPEPADVIAAATTDQTEASGGPATASPTPASPAPTESGILPVDPNANASPP
ncbi:MAG: hypothetical protein GY910_04435 [bacterium]|nr:hypothetical protein [Deltaproteobacteria bacterium]MCP4904207.1 hypothetical protein [bacterium]